MLAKAKEPRGEPYHRRFAELGHGIELVDLRSRLGLGLELVSRRRLGGGENSGNLSGHGE